MLEPVPAEIQKQEMNNYVTYEVDTKNGYVNFIESSFNWEACA